MQDFVNKIVRWYKKNLRPLPWRATNDPYRIWLSEVILQQTRVEQGQPYYEQFTTEHPNIQSLAEESEEKVLRLWQGLGYYSRARNLHKCAKAVVNLHAGHFPNNYKELIKLPGIGPYTAAAIASFAFNEQIACVDGNVYRLLSRYFGIEDDIASGKGQKVFFEKAQSLIPADQPADFNQATMEMGAMICTPKKPRCEQCPVQQGCYAFEHQAQGRLPVKIKKLKIKNRYLNYSVFQFEQRIIMNRRPEKGIWAGLYDFPLHESKLSLDSFEPLLEAYPALNPNDWLLGNISSEYKHILTHQKLFVTFFSFNCKNKAAYEALKQALKAEEYNLEEIEELPKPKIIDQFLSDTFLQPER
ncbi:A/G-specific adenine glycosylase [Persicobacter psychrovividus]|uniref:Adenine DNA glycosylase n=1 Tax=Persicobacter psychrovividus TaxID=387638 RepID=A0ABN6L4A6_9BACT|nr:A/G-specific adenine glycosylase [Persicobacter psychrovividus]